MSKSIYKNGKIYVNIKYHPIEHYDFVYDVQGQHNFKPNQEVVEGVDFTIQKEQVALPLNVSVQEETLYKCPACGGDGKETCNNPDHGFINTMPGEVGRLGCPCCGHHPQYKVNGGKNTCPECGGHGNVSLEQFEEYGRNYGYDEEPIPFHPSPAHTEPTTNAGIDKVEGKEITAMRELISLLPSGAEIKQAIFDNDMDEKMLDEWLWERLYKGRDWLAKEREQIERAFKRGYKLGHDGGCIEGINGYYDDACWQTYEIENNLK